MQSEALRGLLVFPRKLLPSLIGIWLLVGGCGDKKSGPPLPADGGRDQSVDRATLDTNALPSDAPFGADAANDPTVQSSDARMDPPALQDTRPALVPDVSSADGRTDAGIADTATDSAPAKDPVSGTGGWGTVTGGGNLAPEVATSLAELNSLAGGTAPKVIHVSGQFKGTVSVGSNKTIIGLPGAQVSSGHCLKLLGSKNVIVRNMKFVGTPDGDKSTTATVQNSQQIWLDHCEFVDGGDGMLDFWGTTDFVTVSWCKMRYTGKTGHQNATLMAESNGSSESAGKMSITFHHNWWAENIAERQPRVRFGKVHIYNNLYTATPGWTYYAVRCGWKANVLSESNIYKDFKGPAPFGGKTAESLVFNYFDGSPDSVLETRGDVFVNCTERALDGDGVEGGTFGKGTAFKPAYPYNLDPTDNLEAAIRASAGPTL